MKNYCFTISDYEHSGDLSWAKKEVLSKFPKVKNIRTFEERDYEAEYDYKSEYGEIDEPIYQGYIEFDAPKEYEEELKYFNI